MKVRVIICQNAYASGTPEPERKAAPIKQSMYHYVCEQATNTPIKDYYNGYTYRSHFEFELGVSLPESLKTEILGKIQSKANVKASLAENEQLLGQHFFTFAAKKILDKTLASTHGFFAHEDNSTQVDQGNTAKLVKRF